MINSKIPKFQNLRFKFAFVALVLLLFSCNTEDDTSTNPISTITNQLKKELKLDKFASKNISENLIVNWETAKQVEKNNFEIIEIELSEKNKHEIKSDIFQEKLKYELITIKSNNIVHSYFIEAYSSLKYSLFSNSIQDLKNFTGTLNVFEINGIQINQIVVYNGRAENPTNNSSLYSLTSAINSFYESKNLNSKIPVCNIVLAYTTVMWEDWYKVIKNSYGQIVEYIFLHSTYLGTTIQYISTPYACDAAGDAHYFIERTAVYVDKSDPCNQLKALNSNPDFKVNIDWLKSKVNAVINDKENGVEVKAVMNPDETFTNKYTQIASQDEFSVSLSTGGSYIGGVHSHPKNGYGMFSFADVRFLMEAYEGASSARKDSVFFSVVCKDNSGTTNVYTLKVNDIEALRSQINSVWNNPALTGMTEAKKFEKIHSEQAILYAKNKDQLEKSFLEQFAAFGISLYKANDSLTLLNNLTLDLGQSTITATPCN